MPAVNALLATLSWPLVTLWLASMLAFLASAVLLVLEDAAAMVTFVLALALNLADGLESARGDPRERLEGR